VATVKKRSGPPDGSKECLSNIASGIKGVFYTYELADACITYVSPAYADMWGRSVESLYEDPTSFIDVIHPDDRHLAAKGMEQHLKGLSHDDEYRLLRDDGETRWIWDRSHVVMSDDGEPLRVVGIAEDVTRFRRAEAEQRLTVDELDHRTRNMLTVVRSLVSQTLTASSDGKGIAVVMDQRLESLGTAYTLLSRVGWSPVPLDELAGEILAPFRGRTERIRIEGPYVSVSPQASVTLSMVLHELATNAIKYGALSAPDGHVDLRWEEDETPNGRGVTLVWRERGGPVVTPPERQGLGTRMIELLFKERSTPAPVLKFERAGVVARFFVRN